MAIVDWSYHRKNCDSCGKAADFLSNHQIDVKAKVDARTTPLDEADASKLIAEAHELYVTRGTKVFHFNLVKGRPDNESLLELLIGRSGKLRAPTIKVGRTVIVGFDRLTYEQVLG